LLLRSEPPHPKTTTRFPHREQSSQHGEKDQKSEALSYEIKREILTAVDPLSWAAWKRKEELNSLFVGGEKVRGYCKLEWYAEETIILIRGKKRLSLLLAGGGGGKILSICTLSPGGRWERGVLKK